MINPTARDVLEAFHPEHWDHDAQYCEFYAGKWVILCSCGDEVAIKKPREKYMHRAIESGLRNVPPYPV
jgi:hypothetical protein